MEIQQLEVLVMPNGEILCEGNTIGWKDKLGKYLNKKQAITIPLSENDIQELGSGEEYHWTFPTQCGQDIDVYLKPEEEEDYDDEDNDLNEMNTRPLVD